MRRLLPIFLFIQANAQVTINAPGQPATITINALGQPATVAINPIQLEMYSLDGGDDYISVPQTALNFSNTDPQSYEVWFSLDTVGNTQKRIMSLYNPTTTKGTLIYVETSKYIFFYMRNGSGIMQVRASAPASSVLSQILVPKIWYHLVVTYNGVGATGVKMYVDGYEVSVQVMQNTLAVSPENQPNVIFGTLSSLDAFTKMHFSTSRVFSKALSSAEVTTLYNQGQPVNSSISGKVFDLSFNQPALSATMNLLVRNGNQLLIDGKLNYNTYGRAGDARDATTHSPFTDPRTAIYYHDGKTYLAWQQRGYLGGNRQGMILSIDHAGSYATPSYPIGYLSPGGFDTHGMPSATVVPDGRLLIMSENLHGTPIYVRKTTGLDITTAVDVSTITGNKSYPAFVQIGANTFVITRGSVTNAEFMKDYITKSTNNGATWGSSVQILNMDNSTGTDRAYYSVVYHTSKICLFVNMREDATQLFTRIFYIESTDGITFTNIDGSFSKNIVSSGFITRAELEANCFVTGGDDDIYIKESSYTDSGPVAFTNSETGNYQYIYWDGSAWAFKALSIPIYEPVGSIGNLGRTDAWASYAYSDSHQILWRLETRSTYGVIVQYETLDGWDTWDAGTVISDADKNHEQIQRTYNKSTASKIIVAANQLTVDNDSNNIFIYEYTPILD